MPAPDLATLLRFEEQIERATATILRAAGLPACRQREANVFPAKRVEVRLLPGKATGHRGFPTPTTTALDAFNGQLVLSVVTTRPAALTTPALDHGPDEHAEMVGKVRALFCYGAPVDAFNAGALPLLSVDKIEDMGVAPNVNPTQDLDVSPLLYAVVFSIRPTAWPVPGGP